MWDGRVQTFAGNTVLSERVYGLVATDWSLPVIPIAGGFVGNTSFYAVLLWALSQAPFAACRFIRKRRGLCIKCGYDLRYDFSVGCSECGWGRGERVEG